MLAKSVFAATFFALSQFAVASPPGCLLGAVNDYSDPRDLQAVCEAKDATTKIASFCGNDTIEALSAFADICEGQSITLSIDILSSVSASLKPSGSVASTSSSANSTRTTSTGATPRPISETPRPISATSTSPASASGTPNAAGKPEFGVVAAFAGLMAIAL